MSSLLDRVKVRLEGLQTDWRTLRVAGQVRRHAPDGDGRQPVVIFNASTRLNSLSQNAGFAMLSGWALRLHGWPVVHFTCMAGMSRCVLGTDQDDFSKAPPCRSCMHQTRINTWAETMQPFHYHEDEKLKAALQGLDLAALSNFDMPFMEGRLPLGQLVLPSLRWRLRRTDLPDDEALRFLFRQYLLSAWNVAVAFSSFVEKLKPAAVLVFNGQFFPEAVVRWVCRQRGIPSVTHEVAMQPMSGFFTTGEATAYPVDLPDDFALTIKQDARLDAYLEQRMQGNFSMAGIRFWPKMQGLDPAFLVKADGFKQVVAVFTNVIFDTSQPHSNTVFSDMFAWLEQVLDLVRSHPETLFVLRAHPDEKRVGKRSQQNVADWLNAQQPRPLDNLVFVDAGESISSYELIHKSKFLMIYNSTIGMEAAIMGKMVLAAGRSRFTPHHLVTFPDSPQAHRQAAEAFLLTESITVPAEFRINARRFLYYLLYRASLPFNAFLQASRVPGVVRLKPFGWRTLKESPVLKIVIAGLLENKPFLFEAEDDPA